MCRLQHASYKQGRAVTHPAPSPHPRLHQLSVRPSDKARPVSHTYRALQDWEARYAQLRVAVQTAQDRGQAHCSYADIAAQLASKERNVTSAKFAGRSKLAPKPGPTGASHRWCCLAWHERVRFDLCCWGKLASTAMLLKL